MKHLRIAFVLDSETKPSENEYNSIIQQLRFNLYELRNLAFNEDSSFSLGFVIPGTAGQVKTYELDTFSISKENQGTLFQQADEAALKDFDRVIKFSQTGFEPSLVIKFVKKPPVERVEKPAKAAEAAKPADSAPKTKKSRNVLKIIIPVIAACLVLSALPLILYSIKKNAAVYKKVYTGDGDRLILRTEPDKSAKELMRLNEGEVVQLIQADETWDNVEYHGFMGYVSNQYLIAATKDEYEITSPDSMYNYGMACLNYDNQPDDGVTWIKKAADNKLLQAQWEMKKINRDDEAKNLMWLETIAENTDPYENFLIHDWEQKQVSAEQQGNEAAAKNFGVKIDERRQYLKDIYFAAYKKLAWDYLEKNSERAAYYYNMACIWSDFTDTDFLESIANSYTGAERADWLKKAYQAGSVYAAWELASYYDKIGETTTAGTYYKYCYNHYYNRYHAAKYLCLNSTTDTEYFTWLVNLFNESYYSDDYYQLAYLIGYCYENGAGCSQSYYYAMQYYQIAKKKIPEAEDDYDRAYSYYYWYY